MSARALKTQNSRDPQTSSTPDAKNIDNARAHLAKARFVPAEPQQWLKDSLDRRGRLAKESAERREKRRPPAKRPWTEEQKEIAKLWREYRVAEAYKAADAWSFRPRMPNWRVRERWTPAQHEAFAAEFEAFARRVPQPTARQIELVGKDYAKLEKSWNAAPADMVPEPGHEPWVMGKKYARNRFYNGYCGAPDGLAGGKYPIGFEFCESYLRSMLHPLLFYGFVLGTPRGGRQRFKDHPLQPLSGGPAKDNRRDYWSKLQALDQPYITLLSVMRCAFRVELDQNFDGFDELKALLWEMVCNGELACMPHVVVGAIDPDTGALQHPHLWFLLREQNRVLYDRGNTKANADVMDLYDGVVAGVFAALEHLGADMGAASSPTDGKNPLCGQWSAEVWNDSEFPSLQEWSMKVRIWHRLDHLVREQSIVNSALSAEQSNDVFHRSAAMAWAILRAAHMAGDALYRTLLEDRRALADYLFERLLVEFRDEPNQKKCIGTLRRVARYVSGEWDPHKLEPTRQRGEAYHLVREIAHRDADGNIIAEGLEARQMVGRKYSRAKVKAKNVNLIARAMKGHGNFSFDKKNIKKSLAEKMSPGTVDNNWDLALDAFRSGTELSTQCLLGSLPPPRPIPEPTLLPAATRSESPLPIPATILRVWPGGHDGDTSLVRSTIEKSDVVDPCWVSVDIPDHGPTGPAEASLDASPATSQADREIVAASPQDRQAGDGAGVQRGLSGEPCEEWSPDEADDGGSIVASGRRRSDGDSAEGCDRDGYTLCPDRSRKEDTGDLGEHPDVDREQEQSANIQQRGDQTAAVPGGGRDAAAAAQRAGLRAMTQEIHDRNLEHSRLGIGLVAPAARAAADVCESLPQPPAIQPVGSTPRPNWLVARTAPWSPRPTIPANKRVA